MTSHHPGLTSVGLSVCLTQFAETAQGASCHYRSQAELCQVIRKKESVSFSQKVTVLKGKMTLNTLLVISQMKLSAAVPCRGYSVPPHSTWSVHTRGSGVCAQVPTFNHDLRSLSTTHAGTHTALPPWTEYSHLFLIFSITKVTNLHSAAPRGIGLRAGAGALQSRGRAFPSPYCLPSTALPPSAPPRFQSDEVGTLHNQVYENAKFNS